MYKIFFEKNIYNFSCPYNFRRARAEAEHRRDRAGYLACGGSKELQSAQRQAYPIGHTCEVHACRGQRCALLQTGRVLGLLQSVPTLTNQTEVGCFLKIAFYLISLLFPYFHY